MVSDDGPVLTSSTWNCTQDAVTVAPAGTCTPGKRTPTTCRVEPSAISSRSLLLSEVDPLTFCSASSEPVATRTSSVWALPVPPPPADTVIVTMSDVFRAESLATSCSTYVPAAPNVAVVPAATGSPNVTVPGPLAFDHVVVTVAG